MPTAATPRTTRDQHDLISAARSGDNTAWTQLINRHDRMLNAIARSYRLSPHDTDDAIQGTWIKLYEHLHTIRDPNAIAAWLNTTMRREALRLLQTHVREQLTDQPDLTTTTHDTPEHRLLQTEQQHILHHALQTLPTRQRQLMTLIATDTTNYHHISSTLNMPIGSIGPIRARSIARLQRHHELRDYAAA
jgi:RNA polymerase sigma factor (sigma-70 family)